LVWYQEGCPYCERLINTNFSQQEIADYTRAHFDTIALNLWGSRRVTSLDGSTATEKALGKQFDVQFTPTLQFLDASGEVVARLDGYYPPRKFRAALEYVAEEHYKDMALADYLQDRVSPEAGSGEMPEAPFLADPPHNLADRDGPVAVLFEQAPCPACQRFHDSVLDDSRLRSLLDPYHVVQLDRWGNRRVVTPQGQEQSAREWADALGINYVPAMVLFDDGQEVIRMESLFKGFHVRSMLDYVASGAYRDEPRFQNYLEHRSERLRGQGQDVDLWEE
jgi:thioredoxin-related protein